MTSPRLRNALILFATTAGLSGCVGMYPYGSVGVGYGNGGYYDPYGYGGYGSYGGYGYGSPYYGWYDDYYYPGTGYYVYDRYGSRHRWNDTQRRYWETRRRGDTRVVDNWSGYRSGTKGAIQGWWDRQDNGVTTTTTTNGDRVRTDSSSWRQRGDRTRSSRGRSSGSDGVTTRSSRSDRSDRASARATRDAERGIRRVERDTD